MKRHIGNLLLLLFGCAVALALCEGILRRYEAVLLRQGDPPALIDPGVNVRGDELFPRPAYLFQWRADGESVLHIRSNDPRMTYELRPNARINEVLFTNAQGFRDHDFTVPKPEGVFRICVAGDSIAFGWWHTLENTFPKLLERALNASGTAAVRFEVFNMGVGGYNAEQAVALIESRALPLDPDLVILQYCLNDHEMGADAGLWRHFTRSRLRTLDFLYLSYLRLRAGITGKSALHRAYPHLAELSRKSGVPVLVCLFPYYGERERVQADEAFTRSTGLPALNLSELFERVGVDRLTYDGFHPNLAGNALAALALAEAVQAFLPDSISRAGSHPPEAPALLKQFAGGTAALLEERFDDAVALFRYCADRHSGTKPLAAAMLSDKAWALLRSDRAAPALACAEAALALDGGHVDGAVMKAYALVRLGRAGKAFETARAVTDAHPDDARARTILGVAFEETGHLPEAREAYEQALALHPGSLVAAHRLDRVLGGARDAAYRADFWTARTERFPKMAVYHRLLGKALADLGEFERAMAAYRAAAACDPLDPAVDMGIAAVLLAQGDVASARDLLRRVVETHSHEREAYFLLDNTYNDFGDAEGRVREWRQLLQAHPERWLMQIMYGKSLEEKGDYAGAVVFYEDLLRSDPNNSMIKVRLPEVLLRVGRAQEAVHIFREVIQNLDGFEVAKTNFISALLDRNLAEEAHEMARWLEVEGGYRPPPELQQRLGALPRQARD